MDEYTKKIFDKIKPIIAEELKVKEEAVTLKANFVHDLAADSLDLVQLVMRLEDECKLNIPDEDSEKLKTVGDTVNYIKDKTSVPYKP